VPSKENLKNNDDKAYLLFTPFFIGTVSTTIVMMG
jgi:hypothetical protein